jgi:hypothetical protein
MDRRRVPRNHCSGPARTAAIPTQTELFMAITLSRCNRKTEDNSYGHSDKLSCTSLTAAAVGATRSSLCKSSFSLMTRSSPANPVEPDQPGVYYRGLGRKRAHAAR